MKRVGPGSSTAGASRFRVRGFADWRDLGSPPENLIVPADLSRGSGSYLEALLERDCFDVTSRIAHEIENDHSSYRLGIVEIDGPTRQIVMMPSEAHPALGPLGDIDRELRVANAIIAAFGVLPRFFTRVVAYAPPELDGWTSVARSRFAALLPFLAGQFGLIEPLDVGLIGLTDQPQISEAMWGAAAMRVALRLECSGRTAARVRWTPPDHRVKAFTAEVMVHF
jgi:hypothetical protein